MKDLYLKGFQTVLEDFQDQINSPQLELCTDIYKLFLNGIAALDGKLKIDITKRGYTSIA